MILASKQCETLSVTRDIFTSFGFLKTFFYVGLKVYYLAEYNLKIIFTLCWRKLASMRNQTTTEYHLISELCNIDEPKP